VAPAGACGSYNGEYFKNTVNGSAIVHLSVVLTKDPTTAAGDIRTATVKFNIVPVGGGSPIPANAVIDPNNSSSETATFVYDFTCTLGSSEFSKTYDIDWIIGGNYTSTTGCTENSTEVTVSVPTSDFVTGGGYLIPLRSGGTKGGSNTDGLKNNFGFNVKWNKKLTNLQGSFNTIIRRREPTDNNVIHTYQVKSNKAGTLVVYPKTNTTPARAIITYINAVIKDVTYVVNGVCTSTLANCFSDGNGIVTFEVTDHGEPSGTNSTEDEAAIHVKDKNNQLWYSSDVYVPATNKTALLTLTRGNIQIHIAGQANPVSMARPETEAVDITPLGLKALPNPTASHFTLMLTGNPSQAMSLKVTDLLGRVVERRTGLNAGQSLNLGSSYRQGVYIVELTQGNEVRQLKLIKID
jgi:hypothetical protein